MLHDVGDLPEDHVTRGDVGAAHYTNTSLKLDVYAVVMWVLNYIDIELDVYAVVCGPSFTST